MKVLEREQLRTAGCLVPENLQDAMQKYSYEFFGDRGDTLECILKKRFEYNTEEQIYLDFYYGVLSGEERKKACEVLSEEQITYLDEHEWPESREQVYFSYDRELFSIAVRFSETGMLFSTFYFAGTKETVWSNHNGTGFIFFEKAVNKTASDDLYAAADF